MPIRAVPASMGELESNLADVVCFISLDAGFCLIPLCVEVSPGARATYASNAPQYRNPCARGCS
jgi:hypothetical protein